MQHHKAITRQPGANFAEGVTEADLGTPDYELALTQHHNYRNALISCGIEVICLDADPRFPDGCFVEDCAVIFGGVGVITNPGHIRRKGETNAVESLLAPQTSLRFIRDPGTMDGGDILRIDDRFIIGLSGRTNREGADQLSRYLSEAGLKSTTVTATSLHLKTGIAYLGGGTIVCTSDYADLGCLSEFDKIVVSQSESYSANCLRVNDTVFIASGFPNIQNTLSEKGFDTVSLEMSEFQKMDGGLTCLSILL
jgi:dimethylargininase